MPHEGDETRPVEQEKRTGPITREELYEVVWSESLMHAAERYGVTDVAVAKWCRKLDVPKPGRGYWQKVKAGRPPKKPPLPKAAKDQVTWVHRPRVQEMALTAPSGLPIRPPGSDQLPETITVGDELEDPHLLVLKTQSALSRGRKDEYGFRQPRRGSKSLSIEVTDEQVDRALRIADALIKTLEGADHEVGFGSRVTIDGQVVSFSLVEKLARTERQPTAKERRKETWWSHRRPMKYYRYSGSGKLSLVVDNPSRLLSRRRISDTKSKPLETRLIDFIEKLLWDAAHRKRERLEAEERERRRAEEELRRREAEERRYRELQRRAYLEMMVERWSRAAAIRRFADAAESAFAGMDGERPTADDSASLEWARWYADELDPLTGTGVNLMPPADWTHDPENLRTAVQSIGMHLDRVLELSGQRWWYRTRW